MRDAAEQPVLLTPPPARLDGRHPAIRLAAKVDEVAAQWGHPPDDTCDCEWDEGLNAYPTPCPDQVRNLGTLVRELGPLIAEAARAGVNLDTFGLPVAGS